MGAVTSVFKSDEEKEKEKKEKEKQEQEEKEKKALEEEQKHDSHRSRISNVSHNSKNSRLKSGRDLEDNSRLEHMTGKKSIVAKKNNQETPTPDVPDKDRGYCGTMIDLFTCGNKESEEEKKKDEDGVAKIMSSRSSFRRRRKQGGQQYENILTEIQEEDQLESSSRARIGPKRNLKDQGIDAIKTEYEAQRRQEKWVL